MQDHASSLCIDLAKYPSVAAFNASYDIILTTHRLRSLRALTLHFLPDRHHCCVYTALQIPQGRIKVPTRRLA